MKRKKKRKRHVKGGIGMGMTVLVALVISLMSGIGANGFVARIDFQSRRSQSQAMNNIERIAEKELDSDGISLEDTMLIESMSVSKSESDAIVKRASKVD